MLSDVESVVTIAGGILAIAGVVWKPTRRYLAAWFTMPTRIATVETATRELKANGGKTLRDAVDRMEQRLHAGEARSRSILSQMRVAFWESDQQGYCVFVSREMCRVTGYTEEESLGRAWLSTIAPEDRELVMREWDACVRDRRAFKMDYTFVRPDGERVDVRAEAAVTRNQDGQAIGFVGTIERRDERCS